MKRLVMVATGDANVLVPATAIGDPDPFGMVTLSELVEYQGTRVNMVPVEACLGFNEDLLLHYNGLINGASSARLAAFQMLKTYGSQAFELADTIQMKH